MPGARCIEKKCNHHASQDVRDRPLFFPGGGVSGFLGGRKFFPPSIERLQVFSSTPAADNFF